MLVKFQWDELYSVGVPEMDNQHKRFFEISNLVVDFINKNDNDQDRLQTLLSNLVGYSIYHLEFEERYFNKYHYEDRFSHIEGHDAYRTSIQKFVDASEENVADVKKIASDAAEFASKWLQEHILIVDKEYTDFFNRYPIEDYDDYKLLV